MTLSLAPTTRPLSAWIDSLQSGGRYSFTRAEALSATGSTPQAIAASLRRLHKAGRIAAPRRGFHVIVPLEYRVLGCTPAPWFIDDLMKHMGRPYYVGLLTAAAYYGAASQAAQVFQVVADLPVRPIVAGRVRVEFHEGRIVEGQTRRVNTPTGTMCLSTPERTAVDLVRYPLACGGLGHVAALLRDLAEVLDPIQLVESARHVERSVAQRTGWLLELVGATPQIKVLAEWLATQATFPVALRPDLSSEGAPRDERWKVMINDKIEVDE